MNTFFLAANKFLMTSFVITIMLSFTFNCNGMPADNPTSQSVEIPEIWWEQAVNKLNTNNGDLSDLDFLKDLIGNKRIVALGEQTHEDGASFAARARIIDFLISEMDFSVIIYESGVFDMFHAQNLLAESGAIESVTNGFYGFWRGEEQQYMYSQWQAYIDKGQELTFAGFDIKHTSYGYENSNYTKAVIRAVEEIMPQYLEREEFLSWLGIWTDIEEKASRDGIRGALSRLRYKMNRRTKAQFAESNKWLSAKFAENDAEFWAVKIAHLDEGILAYSNLRLGHLITMRRFIDLNNRRDELMASLLEWQLTEQLPNERIILVGATYHFLQNPDKVDPIKIQRVPVHESVIMMNELSQELRDEIYVIGFAAYEGYYGMSRGENSGNTVTKAPEFSLEHQVVSRGYDYAFVSLAHNQLASEFWDASPVIRLLDYHSEMRSSSWDEILDAVVVIREMYPVRF